ncbi:tape measure protein [Aliivibrio fischeri]
MANKLETEIILNLKGNLSEKAKSYGASMSKFARDNERAMSMVQTTTAAASKGIDTLGNRSLIATGAIGVAFHQTFVKTAAEFEKYQIMLNNLQGSPEGGAAAMDWIEEFTQSTPFAVNEVTEAFVKLKAFGLDPMDGSMQSIVDQAAKMGGTAESVEGIALALGQAWTKGKLQGEEALQLLERGVPVWDYLIEASKELGHNNGLGYTAAQLQDMASKGELTKDAITSLITVMGRASSGSAKAQMDSWSGMLSNMGDHWDFFQKDIMDSGAFQVLKDELGDLLDTLDKMKETGEYDKLVETVGQNLVDGFKAAASAATTLKEVGKEFLPVLRAIGKGASSISEAVGGYENLAKILVSVYALNKAIRVGTPLMQGAISAGKWALGRGSKADGKGGMQDLGATPVFVVNMPASGLGGSICSASTTSASTKTSKAVKALDVLGKGLIVGEVMDALFGDTEWAQKAKNTTLSDVFPSVFDNQSKPKQIAQPSTQEILKAVNMEINARSQGGAMGSMWDNFPIPNQGQSSLKIEVSDDRVRVTNVNSSPHLNIDYDNGRN